MPELNPDALTRASINQPDVLALTSSATELAANYNHFLITTADEFTFAGEHLQRIKGARAELEARRLTMTRPLDATKKAIMEFFRPYTERLDNAEEDVKGAMVTYSDEQRRLTNEAARKAREIADREAARLRELARIADEKAAAKERDRLAELRLQAAASAAVENKRLEAERKAAKTTADKQRAAEQLAAEQARQEAEQQRIHEERLAAEASQRERTARAESLEARALATTTAPLAPATPKVAGISSRETWKYEITNRQLIPEEYWQVDEKAIGAVVKALKGQTRIPGVRVYAETAIAARKA